MAEFAFQYWNRVDDLLGGMSLKELSEKIGMSYATLKDMRTRNRYPKQEISLKIANVLHTSIDYLIYGDTAVESSCPEAEAVKGSPELQALVRAMTKDPKLLQVVAALVELKK